MAVYTMTIQDILDNDDKNKDIDYTTASGAYQAGMNSIFTDEMLLPIEESRRVFFVTSFIRHYMLDEIGQETLQAFKMYLAGKIYENAGYINQIFDHFDEQIFSVYRVHKVKSTTIHDNTINNQSNNNETVNGVTKRTGGDKVTVTGGDTVTLNQDVKKSGDITSTTTGGDTTTNTGTTTRVEDKDQTTTIKKEDRHGGQDTHSKQGTDDLTIDGTVANGGTTTVDHTGSDTVGESGTDQVVNNNSTRHQTLGDAENTLETVYNSSVNDNLGAENESTVTQESGNTTRKNTQAYSDTPQNGLEDVEGLNYLTDATINTEVTTPNARSEVTRDLSARNNSSSKSGSDKVINREDYSDTGESTDTTTYGKDTKTTYNTQDVTTDDTTTKTDRTDKRIYNDQDQTQYGKTINTDETEKVTGGGTITDTLNTQNKTEHNTELKTADNTNTNTSGTTTTEKNEVTDTAKDETENRSDVREGASSSDTSDKGESQTIEEFTDNTLNYEMLLEIEPLMIRIWAIFQPLFMVIRRAYSYYI